jgi:hypothetical protein
VSFGNSLTADTAYFTIVVYSILIPAMAQKIPVAAAATAELLVSIRRIQVSKLHCIIKHAKRIWRNYI